MGYVKYFLGIELARSSEGLFISQRKYILDMLQDVGLSNAKHAPFPMAKALRLSPNMGDLMPDPEKYRKVVGKLLYLSLTRPDITYSVQQLSQFLQSPRIPHWQAVVQVLKYLRGCPSKGVFFPAASSFKLQAYCDADWAACPTSRRSITGFCIFLGSALIS